MRKFSITALGLAGLSGTLALIAQASTAPVSEVFKATRANEACVATPALTAMARVDPAKRTRLSQALEAGYGVQYWGNGYTPEQLAAAPHGMLIVEATKVGALHSENGRELRFDADEVRLMNRQGSRPVLAYLNVAEIEDYRDYWVQSPTEKDRTWFGPLSAHNERLAAYWTPAWHDILMERVDQLMALGFDGLFLDDVMQYYSFAAGTGLRWPANEPLDGPKTAPEYAREMMSLVKAVAARVRAQDCHAIMVVNNGTYIGRDAGPEAASSESSAFSSYLGAIDAIMIENVFGSAAEKETVQALKEDYQAQGVEVLTLDYTTHFERADPARLQWAIAERAKAEGFTPYLAENEAFDRLYPPTELPVPPDHSQQ